MQPHSLVGILGQLFDAKTQESSIRRKPASFVIWRDRCECRKESSRGRDAPWVMPSVSHLVFIDESGSGSPGFNVQRVWITAAVAVSLETMAEMDEGVKRMVASHFRPWMRELKGSDMPHGLRSGTSIEEVARELGGLTKKVEARVWITGSQYASGSLAGHMTKASLPKDVARRLMLERVSGFLGPDREAAGRWLLIWDITDQQELSDFSRSVANFRIAHEGETLDARLVPAVLGGLSHDWSGLQAADLFANMALHRLGLELRLPGTRSEKAKAFSEHLESCLQRDPEGSVQGCTFM